MAPTIRAPVSSPDNPMLSQRRFHQAVEIFGHVGGIQEILVVSKADVRFPRIGPVNKILRRLLLRFVRKCREVRRGVGEQQLIVAESQQTRQRRFDRIDDVALRFRLGEESLRQRRRSTERVYFDAGIFCFECSGNLVCSAQRRELYTRRFCLRAWLLPAANARDLRRCTRLIQQRRTVCLFGSRPAQ